MVSFAGADWSPQSSADGAPASRVEKEEDCERNSSRTVGLID
jgi:hypothetical protein